MQCMGMPSQRVLIRIAKQKLLRKKAAGSRNAAKRSTTAKARLLEETKGQQHAAKQNTD
jgi:hypothetical protein